MNVDVLINYFLLFKSQVVSALINRVQSLLQVGKRWYFLLGCTRAKVMVRLNSLSFIRLSCGVFVFVTIKCNFCVMLRALSTLSNSLCDILSLVPDTVQLTCCPASTQYTIVCVFYSVRNKCCAYLSAIKIVIHDNSNAYR